jgi:hypothetical protein
MSDIANLNIIADISHTFNNSQTNSQYGFEDGNFSCRTKTTSLTTQATEFWFQWRPTQQVHTLLLEILKVAPETMVKEGVGGEEEVKVAGEARDLRMIHKEVVEGEGEGEALDRTLQVKETR